MLNHNIIYKSKDGNTEILVNKYRVLLIRKNVQMRCNREST